jgi:hypothetical protein
MDLLIIKLYDIITMKINTNNMNNDMNFKKEAL